MQTSRSGSLHVLLISLNTGLVQCETRTASQAPGSPACGHTHGPPGTSAFPAKLLPVLRPREDKIDGTTHHEMQ